MSEVISFKVRREIKEKMLKYKDRVNWPELLRKFVEEKIRELEAEDNFKKILNELHNAPWKIPKGLSAKLVRENRDSY